MLRFFLPPALFENDIIELPPEVCRHLRARRVETGADLLVLDGRGLVCRSELIAFDRHSARVKIIGRDHSSEPPFKLTLLFGLAKGEKFDLVLQKGTELGVHCFLPVACCRSERQLRSERLAAQLQRWQRIVREAAQQSRRDHLPLVLPPRPLSKAIEDVAADERLVAWEQEMAPLMTVLPSEAPKDIALVVGPEGGLDPEEIAELRLAGYKPVSLGPRILRCETAGIAVASVLLYLYGDLGS